MNRFEITRMEIEAAYAPQSEARRIHFEYDSDYRRIVVLAAGTGFEIRTDYKGIAKEHCKTWSTFWGVRSDAMAWAKSYAENRNIICGNLTIIERIGKQLI